MGEETICVVSEPSHDDLLPTRVFSFLPYAFSKYNLLISCSIFKYRLHLIDPYPGGTIMQLLLHEDYSCARNTSVYEIPTGKKDTTDRSL